jgi:hypothetical protein
MYDLRGRKIKYKSAKTQNRQIPKKKHFYNNKLNFMAIYYILKSKSVKITQKQLWEYRKIRQN